MATKSKRLHRTNKIKFRREEMIYASRDVTYYVNEKCQDRCWRHVSKYRFNDDEYYYYMDICPKEQERQDFFGGKSNG